MPRVTLSLYLDDRNRHGATGGRAQAAGQPGRRGPGPGRSHGGIA